MEGYIKLHRKMLQWEWHDKPEMVSLFLHLLLLANHDTGKWQGVEVKRGQLITGLKSLNQQTGISTQTLRTCFLHLKSTGEITYKSTNKFRIITIVNWEEYQNSTSKSTNKPTINQQSTNNQLTANKNDKNDKNITKVIQMGTFGNEDINKVVSFLKEKLGGTPDGSVADNRRFAKLLLDRMKKDYPEKSAADQVCSLIEFGLRDTFHSKNITSFKYLYYNAQKIIQSIKEKVNNPKVIKI